MAQGAPPAFSERITADAAVFFSSRAYFGLVKKVRSPGPAPSIAATFLISISPSPSRRHPRRSASSFSFKMTEVYPSTRGGSEPLAEGRPRGSRFAVRGSRFAVRGSRFAVREEEITGNWKLETEKLSDRHPFEELDEMLQLQCRGDVVNSTFAFVPGEADRPAQFRQRRAWFGRPPHDIEALARPAQ